MPDGNAPLGGLADRWATIRGKAYEDWWCRAIGGPIGNFIAAALAPVQWFTADLASILSGPLRLGAVPLILTGHWPILAAARLMLGALFDVVDGGLARLRGATALGGILDKAIDVVCLAAVYGAAGWHVAIALDARWPLLAGAFVAWSVLFRGYLLWVVRGLIPAPATAGVAGPDRRPLRARAWAVV